MPGIYTIVNLENGKKYVGQAQKPEVRLNAHFNKLRKSMHPSTHLQAAFLKYGEAAFGCLVLEECEQEELTDREDFWIFELGAEYNKRPATAASNLGMVMSFESRKKQSEALQKACASPEARARLAETSRKGWEVNREERLAKICAAWTDDKREAFGKLISAREGLQEQLAEARKVRWSDPEQRQKASETAKRLHDEGRLGIGKKHTEQELRAAAEAQGWEVRAITGARMKDKVLLYCPKHDHEQYQTVRKLVHNQRGCRECGWDRVRKT